MNGLKLTNYIPLKLPQIIVNGAKIEQVSKSKFLGVLIDENINWNEHIKLVESKLSKNIGILFKAKNFLDKTSMRNLYFSFINVYINYANIAWGSAPQTKLKKIYSKQKQASRIILNEERDAHSKPLMKSLDILNVYQLNIFQHLLFMHKVKNETTLDIFKNRFSYINHGYPTNYSKHNFNIPLVKLNYLKRSISFRGPNLWNKLLDDTSKETISFSKFKTQIKSQLFDIENECQYF